MAEADPGPPHVDVAGYVLGLLDAGERPAFERHLAGCRTCQRELEELRRLPGLVAEAGDPVDVPAGMEARVLAAVAAEPDAAPRPAVVARPRVVRSRRPFAWALAAAAAIALAFLGGLGLGRGLPGGGPAPAPPAQTIRLVATNGGDASGVATIRDERSGRVIELTVHDLPPAPSGHFYTCWLVADDDTLTHQDRVSIGSFLTAPDGTAAVRWETAADPAKYPHLGVTLEPDNGSPLHQGPKVLTSA